MNHEGVQLRLRQLRWLILALQMVMVVYAIGVACRCFTHYGGRITKLDAVIALLVLSLILSVSEASLLRWPSREVAG